MTAWLVLVLCAGAACASYVLSRFAVLPWLRRHGVMDHPTARSSHDVPVVRGGGIAVAVTFCVLILIALVAWPVAGGLAPGASGEAQTLAASTVVGAGLPAVAGLLFGAVGLVDDFNSLSASGRLFVQILLAALLTAGLAFLRIDWGAPVGPMGAAAVLLSLVLVVNATNFVDGLNTLVTVWGAVAALWLAVVGLVVGQSPLAVSALALAGALLGFLPLNWSPADAFLGDVGSYAVGGFLAVLMWVLWSAGAPVTAVLAPFVVPVFDVLVTLCRRLMRGENIFHAHRSHIYQRIQGAGLRHEQVSGVHLLAVLACLGAAVPNVLSPSFGGLLAALLGWAAVLTVYALGPRTAAALRSRKEEASQ